MADVFVASLQGCSQSICVWLHVSKWVLNRVHIFVSFGLSIPYMWDGGSCRGWGREFGAFERESV